MKVLVLAAGHGARLGDAAGGLPKPLVDVGGTTPLEVALECAVSIRPERIWINVHRHARAVESRIGAQVHGVPVSYSHEPELLGTAGGWKRLEQEWAETSIVLYGDNITRLDLAAMLRAHRSTGALVTMALIDPLRHAHTGGRGGRATCDGWRVVRFVEGGSDGMINAGVYCIEPELRERLPAGFSDFGNDVFPGLASAGVLGGHVMEDDAYCIGVDTPERLERARRMLRGNIVKREVAQ